MKRTVTVIAAYDPDTDEWTLSMRWQSAPGMKHQLQYNNGPGEDIGALAEEMSNDLAALVLEGVPA